MPLCFGHEETTTRLLNRKVNRLHTVVRRLIKTDSYQHPGCNMVIPNGVAGTLPKDVNSGLR